jgi:hypothetical protein
MRSLPVEPSLFDCRKGLAGPRYRPGAAELKLQPSDKIEILLSRDALGSD